MKGSAVLERVLQTISRYSMLAAGARVGVAVSGGADSVCLLHLLREAAPRFGLTLSVAHFNHKLRGAASDEDERFVAQVAADAGLAFYRADADLSETRGNLEQAARRARGSFLAGLIRDGCVDRIALGHTRDDQAETVLFRLMRGSGLAGLAGIYPATAEGFIRPLIGVTRAEVERYLHGHKIRWRDDASNRDPRFARNRIRRELLPQLQREWNPQLGEALARLADLAQEEESWWRAEVDRLAQESIFHRSGGVEMPAPTLAGLPRAAARRLVRRAIEQAKDDLRRIEFEHVEGVLDLATRRAGEGRLRLPALVATRSHDWIRLARPVVLRAIEPVSVTIPGIYALSGGDAEIHLELTERGRTAACATLRAELCLRRVPLGLELRGWRPGDHYRPVGQSRDQKVKEMFQSARVPSWKRRFWPILTSGDKILWAREFGAAADFATGEDPGPVVRIWEADPAKR
jgi:tRNA(Ile)-lysidine synthase